MKLLILQIALLQKESEIPVEELLARYKKVGKMSASACLMDGLHHVLMFVFYQHLFI